MTPSDVMERFQLTKKDIEKYTIYRRTTEGIVNRLNRDSASYSGEEDVNLAIAVWEYWDKTTQTVYTWCEGSDKWCSCLLYTSPSPRDGLLSRMPSSA